MKHRESLVLLATLLGCSVLCDRAGPEESLLHPYTKSHSRGRRHQGHLLVSRQEF